MGNEIDGDVPISEIAAKLGKRGGDKTKQKHGSAHFKRAGSLGGKSLANEFGGEGMAALGRLGGLAKARKARLRRLAELRVSRSLGYGSAEQREERRREWLRKLREKAQGEKED
jgi:hypothetical protein